MKSIRTIEDLNQVIKETISNYYKNHDAESFFSICDLLNAVRSHDLTVNEIPQLIEMQNIIVMG